MDKVLGLKSNMEMLAASILKITEYENNVATRIPGLTLFRKTDSATPMVGFYEPSVCLIAQGAKRVQLGEESFFYDSEHYLFSGIHLPVAAQVIGASEDNPYLGLKLTFDYQEIMHLMADSQLPPPKRHHSGPGMATGRLSLALVSAFQRLVELVDDDSSIPMLAPMIRKEIFYRLLVGEQGEQLRQLAAMGTQTHQVAKAIAWLKINSHKPVRVEDLAEVAHMGVSTFHHHFRNMTSLSPLQYIKQLRLQEARRLMLTEHFDVAKAAFKVGYESPSQFSREYGRLFGCSPSRDVKEIREKLSGAKRS